MSARACERTEEISGLREHELAPDQRAHARECEACRQALARTQQIVDLARSLDTAPIDPARHERERMRLLASAGARARRSPSPRRAGAIALAALLAAAVVLALTTEAGRPTSEAPAPRVAAHGSVRASAGAHFTLLSDTPDEIVRLVSGTITLSVTPLEPGERFRVVVGDAEVEVHGTVFEVEAEDDVLRAVRVLRGRVEVRRAGERPTFLDAGERWVAPVAAATSAATELDPDDTVVLDEAVAPRPHRARHEAPSSDTDLPPSSADTVFAQARAALREGRNADAVPLFESVVSEWPRSPLAEEASFWRAVALSRGGDDARTREALDAFVLRYPDSPRLGTIEVMLGWRRLEHGERDAAREMFERALHDPSERVRVSATRGIAALDASP